MIILKKETVDVSYIKTIMDKMMYDTEYNTYCVDKANVEIQLVPMYGIILIYTDDNSYSFTKFRQDWSRMQINAAHANSSANSSANANSHANSYASTFQYTNQNIIPFGYVRERHPPKPQTFINLTCEDIRNIASMFANNSEFKWYVKVIKKSSGNGHIVYANHHRYLRDIYNHNLLDRHYLLSAASTIVYDTIDMFKEEVKQLDFPRIDQLTYHDKGNIIFDANNRSPSSIVINGSFTVDTNIVMHYLQKYYPTYKDGYVVNNHILQFVSRWIDTNVSLNFDNISINNDVDMYADELCFISKCPLFGQCYKITLSYNIKGKPISDHIIVLDLFLRESLSSRVSFRYNTSKVYITGIDAILSIYKARYGIKTNIDYSVESLYFDNLSNTLNNMEIPQNKKNLLMGIGSHGFYKLRNGNKFYCMNAESNQIFIGLTYISDNDILAYQRSSTVLFSYSALC